MTRMPQPANQPRDPSQSDIRRGRLTIRAEHGDIPTRDQKERQMTPMDCPRFQTCNAPLCPLDSIPTVHLPGEKVCYYLLASGKAGAIERFGGDPVFRACLERLPEIVAAHPPIARKVEAAARSGFQGAHLLRSKPAEAGREAGNGVSDIRVEARA